MRSLIGGSLLVLVLLVVWWLWHERSTTSLDGAEPAVAAGADPTSASLHAAVVAPEQDGERTVPEGAADGTGNSSDDGLEHLSCVVTGRVTDSSSSPIAGAVVRLHPYAVDVWSAAELADSRSASAASLRRATTAPDGRFRIACTPPDCRRQLLVVEAGSEWCELAAEFGSGMRAGPALAAGENDVGDLVVQPAGKIIGRIVDPQGGPIKGAVVVLARQVGRVTPQARSGLDGRFDLGGLPEGPAELWVSLATYVTRRDVRARVATRSTVDLGDVVLTRALQVRGILVDTSGRPVPQQFLRAESSSRQASFPGRSETDGTFAIFVDGAEAHTLTVRDAPDYEDWGSREDPAAQVLPGAEPVRIVLLPRVRMTFRVVDGRTQAPIERFASFLRTKLPPNSEMSLGAIAFEEHDRPGGELQLPASSERQELLICATGYAGRVFEVREDLPGRGVQTLPLRPESVVTGRVTLGGMPLAGAWVYLRREYLRPDGTPIADDDLEQGGVRWDLSDLEGRLRNVESGEDGRFRFGGLAPGTYQVFAKAKTTDMRFARGVRVAPESATEIGDIVLAEGAVVAGVLIPPPGHSAAGFRVYAGGTTTRELVISDPRGTFQLEGLTPGECHVGWQWPDELDYRWSSNDARMQRIVLVEAGRHEVEFDTRPFERCEVSARVLRGEEPVAGASIVLKTWSAGRVSDFGRAFGSTDAQGHMRGSVDGGLEFELALDVPGSSAVSFGGRHTSTAGGRLELRLQLQSGTLAVELPPGFELPAQGALQVHVVGADGERLIRSAATSASPWRSSAEFEWRGRLQEFGIVALGAADVEVKFLRNHADPTSPGRWTTSPLREPYTTRVTIRDGERTVVKVP